MIEKCILFLCRMKKRLIIRRFVSAMAFLEIFYKKQTNACRSNIWIYFRLNLLIENFCCDLILLWTTNSRHCFRLIKVLLSMGIRWRLPCDWKMIISIEIDKNRNSLSWLNFRIYINKSQYPSSYYYCQHIFSLYIT